MITVDDKKYDETKLSDEGKVALNNIEVINKKQNEIRIQHAHNEILLKHYLDILKAHLPEEIKEEALES
jgi:hypothetical protein|tara:strand:- start:684 stop:890 length:207 start_codon:yes stop_codon:yes gene_type:complete